MAVYKVVPTRCSCHPETCCCEPYTLLRDGEVLVRSYERSDLEEIKEAMERK